MLQAQQQSFMNLTPCIRSCFSQAGGIEMYTSACYLTVFDVFLFLPYLSLYLCVIYYCMTGVHMLLIQTAHLLCSPTNIKKD